MVCSSHHENGSCVYRSQVRDPANRTTARHSHFGRLYYRAPKRESQVQAKRIGVDSSPPTLLTTPPRSYDLFGRWILPTGFIEGRF